jgi:hypothetical protein
MNTPIKVEFALVAHLNGIKFDRARPEGIEFDAKSEDGLRFKLLPRDPEKDGEGHRCGIECKAFASLPATEEQVAFVSAYNDRNVMLRVAEEIELPYCKQEEELIDKNGGFKNSFHPRRYFCPTDIIDLIETAESQLALKVNRFLKLLRWRQGVDAPCRIVEHCALYWKVGGTEYPLAPLPGGSPADAIEVPCLHGIHWDHEHIEGLRELWSDDSIEEPLGHELVREAWDVMSGSPRSSILIMTAALETAVKMHISRVAPDTVWLMQELPAPPIFKVLRDYIPSLHKTRGKNMDFWEVLKPSIKQAQKLIEVRNKVAHTGSISDGDFSLRDALQIVSDLLYILDVLEGNDWAKTQVSPPIRRALGWPPPKDGRMTLSIQMA